MNLKRFASFVGVLGLGLMLSGLLAVSAPVAAHNDDLPTPTPRNPDDIVTSADAPTYYGDVQQIFQQNCVSCHIEGEFGYDYFDMTDLDLVLGSAQDIAFYVDIGYMPPWPPSHQSASFLYDRSMTTEDVQTVLAWVNAGAPLGDPADSVDVLPAASVVPPVRPDLMLTMDEPYAPRTDRLDDYRCFIIDPEFATDTFVTGYTVQPGNNTIVHHTILYLGLPEQRAQAEAMDGADGKPGWECFGGTNLRSGFGASDTNDQIRRFVPLLQAAGGLEGLNEILAAPDAVEQFTALLAEVDTDGSLTATIDAMGGVEVFIGIVRRSGILDGTGGGGGGMLGLSRNIGSWTPGNFGARFPDGTGMLMPAGSFIVMQMHYNNAAGNGTDQSTVVLETSNEPNLLPLRTQSVAAPVEIPCPAGVSGEQCTREYAINNVDTRTSEGLLAVCDKTVADYADQTAEAATSTCEIPVPQSGWAVSINSHMHELGASTRTVLNPGTADEQILIDIPNWDFDWQGDYWFAEPVWIDAGDVVQLTCTWDNSVSNRNPEPRYVVWGEGTSDEMCLNFIIMLPAEPGTPFPGR